MKAWGIRLSWRHAMLLVGSAVLAACAGVLGIEERRLDGAESYPELGYEGCRPADGCTGCLTVHRDECEVRSACAPDQALGECAGCVCANCVEPMVDCRLDAGCNAIWQCLLSTRCDLAGSGAGSCLEGCADVIAANGGLNGEAFRAAAAIRTCAVTSSCLSCLPRASAPPPPGCSPQDGCMNCSDCFQQCLCSGDRFSDCQDLCGDDAPSSACSEEDDCAACNDCFEVCACHGGSFESCTAQCSGGGGSCSSDTGCSDCGTCADECICNGGDTLQCQLACEGPIQENALCRAGAGENSCDGCQSCLAACSCEGTPLEECMDDCRSCACEDTKSCSAFAACACDGGNSAQDCFAELYGGCDEFAGCDRCPCQQCPGVFAACQQTNGCMSIFQCMRATKCQGNACQARCAGVNAGDEAPDAFGMAEALWACSAGAACSCGGNVPAQVFCGGVECSRYEVDNAFLLDACCADPAAVVPAAGDPAPPEGDGGCGLRLERYSPNCIPRGQPNAPRGALETCDGMAVFGPPYYGARLAGCCREDGLCGYWDDVTGLGCVEASVLGGTRASCGF